ncbi:MAG: class I SAM-dependent methyltransferase [Candidatus Helarchaeota archaeon]
MVRNEIAVKKSVKKAFDVIARDWNRLRERPWKVLLNFIEKYHLKKLFSKGILLDIGCGNGRHSILLAEGNDQVIGVDFAVNLLKIAVEKCKSQGIQNASFVLADTSALPFKTNTFSNVIYLSTLHHIPTQEIRVESLKDLKRILKTQGICLISVWRRWQKRFFWYFFKQFFIIQFFKLKIIKLKRALEFGDIEISWKMQEGNEIQRFYHLFSKRELVKLLKAVGFEIILRKNFGGPTHRDNIFVIFKIAS